MTRCSGGGAAQLGQDYSSKGTVTRTLVWQQESPVSRFLAHNHATLPQTLCCPCIHSDTTCNTPPSKIPAPANRGCQSGKNETKGAAVQTDIRVEKDRVQTRLKNFYPRTGHKGPDGGRCIAILFLQPRRWGPTAGCGKSRPHRDSISGLSSQQTVAIPTELSRPIQTSINLYILKRTKYREGVLKVGHGRFLPLPRSICHASSDAI